MRSHLSNTQFKAPQTSEAWADLFFDACQSGDLERVKQLYSPKFKSIADIHSNGEEGFFEACANGHLDLVKFLTTSPEVLEAGHTLVDIHALDEQGFRLACENGYPEIVKFLTTSKELLAAGHTFVDIHANRDQGFSVACANGHFDVVKFLTTSPELLEAGHTFVDIHVKDEEGFRWACANNHWNVVQFLIFELKIERTSAIDIIIKDYPQAQELFRVREEQEQIQQSLIESRSTLKNSTSPAQEIKSIASFRI